MRAPHTCIFMLILTCVAAVDNAEGVDLDPDILAPLAVRVLNAPHPVLGADGRIHLAYEVSLVNQSPLLVTIDKVNVLHDNAVIQTLQGDSLAQIMLRSGGESIGTLLRPSHSGHLFMDVSFPKGAE